jgi:Ca2+-binding EF-hand superfamily protein
MPALEPRAAEEAFDALDACAAGSITTVDAKSLIAALGVDATQQAIAEAFAAKESEDAVGRKIVPKQGFVDVVAQLSPAAFGDDDNFAAFAALDHASSSRVPASALEAAASEQVFSACEQAAAGKAAGRFAAYPAKGMSLTEWRAMLQTVASPADGTAPKKKATKL